MRRLKDPLYQSDDRTAEREHMQKILAMPAHGFEVKSLLKTSRNYAQMNPRALAAKKRWGEKYGIAVHTAVVDARRGSKFSGHSVYVAPNTVAPTVSLGAMQKATSHANVLDLVRGSNTGEHSSG